MIFEPEQELVNLASLFENKARSAVLFRNCDRNTTLLMSVIDPLSQSV